MRGTVRAYCTQDGTAMAKIRIGAASTSFNPVGRDAVAIEVIRIAIRMKGIDNNTSPARMITLSIQPP